jgi:hypothetical protein
MHACMHACMHDMTCDGELVHGMPYESGSKLIAKAGFLFACYSGDISWIGLHLAHEVYILFLRTRSQVCRASFHKNNNAEKVLRL